MRRFISLPAVAVVLLLACDGNGSQDLTAPESQIINASVQDQITALGCEAYWVDYSNGPIPVCDPADPSCLRDEWLADNIHFDGFVVEGNTIYGTENRDVILCHRSDSGTGVKLFGDKGNDTLFGTNWDDELHGGPGCDRIRGRDGRDLIDAGIGNDGPEDRDGCASLDHRTNPWLRLQGGVWGDAGDDELVGGPGNDWINGGPGIDLLIGGPGSDLLFGHSEDDELQGGPGTDELLGGSHYDICHAGPPGEGDTFVECESILSGNGDGIPERATGDVWLQAGPDQVHVAFSAHAATTKQPARGWVTFEGDIEGFGPLAAAGTVTAVFDHTVYGPPLENGTELCVCGVMTSTTGPPPPPPPWPPPAPYGGDWVTAPDTDDDGTDNEFCMYVVDAGEPGSEGANDAAVVLHEGFPWSFWFPDPYPSPGICDAVKTAAPGMAVISGNVQVHDNK
jgi:hypothetical protein